MDFVMMRRLSGGKSEGAECAEDSAGSGSSDQLKFNSIPSVLVCQKGHGGWDLLFSMAGTRLKEVARIYSSFLCDGLLRSR